MTELATDRRPAYVRLLRLRHLRLRAWHRALLGEGSVAVSGLLVLADLATAWTLIALPAAVAGMVKAHDLFAGRLSASSSPADRCVAVAPNTRGP